MNSSRLDALLEGFVSLGWGACLTAAPGDGSPHVYAIVVSKDNQRFPLYVGQTTRLGGRVGDYIAAQFKAPTDFRVGEAIKHLRNEKHWHVEFLYRQSEAHVQDEKVLIRELLLAGYTLLNFLSSFDYRTATIAEERALVHRFCDMALSLQGRVDLAGE